MYFYTLGGLTDTPPAAIRGWSDIANCWLEIAKLDYLINSTLFAGIQQDLESGS